MRNILLFGLLLLAAVSVAQVPDNIILTPSIDADPEVLEEEICWSVGAVDSSLTRFTYIDPSDNSNNTVLFYVNSSGQTVDVVGGTLSLGFCGCCENTGVVSAGAGLFVYRLTQGEDYSLPLDTLAKYDQLFFYASGNDELNDTATINLPTFPDNGSDTYIGKQLFFHLQELTADSSSAVIITAPGVNGSRLRQWNCYSNEVTTQNDTFTVKTEGVERLIKYTTVPRKDNGDYFRECAGVISDNDYTIGNFTAAVTKIGGGNISLTNPSVGTYRFTIPAGTHLDGLRIFGNTSCLDLNQGINVEFDNSANGRPITFIVQLYDANPLNNGLVDQQISSTVHKQVVTGNINSLQFPGMNNFGTNGFYIELR